MEDEQGNLRTVSGEGVVESPVNVSLPDETLMEHADGKNQIRDSYVVEDGGEIMVEIVGSDVFVDGVSSSSNKECDFESADIAGSSSHTLVNREENNTQSSREATAVLSNSAESGLELSASRNEQNHAVPHQVEVKYIESVAVSEVSSHEVNVSNDEVTEERATEDETVDNDSVNANHGSSELLNVPVEASVVREIGGAEVDINERAIKEEKIDKGASANTVDVDQPIIVTPVAEVANDQNIEISQEKVLEADEPSRNGVGIDTKVNPAENICLSANDAENQVAESNPVNAEIALDNLVEAYRSPQRKEVEVSLQKTDTGHDGFDMLENITFLPNGVDGGAAISFPDNHHVNTSSMISGNTEVATSNDEIIKSREYVEDSSRISDIHIMESHTSETRLTDVEEGTELDKEYHQEEEVDAETEQLSDQVVYSRKRKALDPLTDGSDKRVNINDAKISASTDQNPKSSFKIGDCILRVASQFSYGSAKMNEISAESSSLIDMLSQLQLVAQDPNKLHKFQNEIITFFSGFRSSILVNKRIRKKKSDKSVGGAAEEFEFDDANDSYWTDRIVQNNSEKQLSQNNENGEGNLQLAVPLDGEKPVKSVRKSISRKKRYFTGDIPNASEEFEEKIKRMKQESSPAELVLNFAERKCVPSEINLNKTFRRFGPLMESETEVDHDSGRAKVIFKRGSDAEVAHNSAQKFNIFGPVLVNYQLGYSPLISVKISPLKVPQS